MRITIDEIRRRRVWSSATDRTGQEEARVVTCAAAATIIWPLLLD